MTQDPSYRYSSPEESSLSDLCLGSAGRLYLRYPCFRLQLTTIEFLIVSKSNMFIIKNPYVFTDINGNHVIPCFNIKWNINGSIITIIILILNLSFTGTSD